MMHPSALMAFQLRSAIGDLPLAVSPDTTIMAVARRMSEIDAAADTSASPLCQPLEPVDLNSQLSSLGRAPTGCVLVVEDKRLVGIVTDRDLVRLLTASTNLVDVAIREVMTHPVITLTVEEFTDLSVAIDLLCQHQIRYLPLLDRQGCAIGMLTYESLQQRSHPDRLWQERIYKLERELIAIQKIRSQLEQSNQELTTSNQALTHSTQLKDEFLTNMSHELRTPLNAILGMAEGLHEGIFGTVNPSQIQAVKTIEDSSNHLLALIDDILDLAKIGANRIELECLPTDICELCYSSLSFVKQQAIEKQIRLQIELPPRIPNLVIDERRIRQVLINLLNNAVKFTPIGGHIALNVTIESDNTTMSYVRLAVIDTGIGINSADLVKLFQPFIQVDSALNRQYNGAGLGLALVKGIVKMHGGSVQVRSEVGIGSQFIVDLPIPPSTSDGTGNILSPSLEFSQPIAHKFDLLNDEITAAKINKILLAEDNEANIKSIASFLNAKGYQTILAKNGLEAINLAQSELPDLILMDIQMPKMDGIEAIRYIRQHPQLLDIPIVAVTALAMSGDREKCLSAGANEYLTKPVKLKQLSTTIQQFLGNNN
jgi:signal transduction histidine kinase/ActR/RegA family two-component response regulator